MLEACRKGYYTWISGIFLSVFLFVCSGNAALGSEKMETIYYYIVQPGDSLWKISEELCGDGSDWEILFRINYYVADPSLIYPGMKLEIPGYVFPDGADGRFVAEKRKEVNYRWLNEGYVHSYDGTPERAEEYPKKTEEEALSALKAGNVEDWLEELSVPRILTEKEKEAYRKKDSEDILYSYETERGLPGDIWYLLTENDGISWLVIENQERGKSQEFYRFIIRPDTGEIGWCEKVHGAGGRLYLTEEDGISVWVMTREVNGEIIGVAGDYRGTIYIGGNFYYERQKDGTVAEAYQSYHSIGSGTIRAEWATSEYPY